MKRRLVFQAQAEADLAAVVDLYESKRSGLGRELLAAVERALSAIEEAPGAQPLFQQGHPFRKYTLARFPCVIVFREQASEITTLAVVHGKRRPTSAATESQPSL